MSDTPIYILERTFDAPRELVWRTFTESELLSHWYGPGVETVIHELNVTPGGVWLNEMKMGENSYYQRAEYLEVEAPGRLVWLHSTADAEWNIADNPMMPNWPKVLMTVVTFEENDGKTNMRLTWEPHESSPEEIEVFSQAIAGLDQGWGKGMEMLAELLESLQSG
ncbi:MAG: SRPBCC domain-containing protein [Boseongicola sp.]|nr:SRPBCC domain-containing protein [Boseongicola sp.]MDD9976851.1 SRPBCC domain-containing protein [Boseongicola sp.]